MKKTPEQIDFVLKIMQWSQMHPYKITKFSRVYQIIGLIVSIYMVTLHLMELIVNFNGVETVTKTRFTPCILIKNVQYAYFAFASKTICKTLDVMQDFWPWDKYGTAISTKLEAYSKTTNSFVKFYFWLIIVNVVIMLIEPYFYREYIFDQFDFCDMKNNDICYYFNFTILSLHMCLIYVPAVLVFDLMFLAFMGQIYIQFELLKVSLAECKPDANNPTAALKEIVDQHNVIIEFTNSYESWTSRFFLAKYAGFLIQMIAALYMLTFNGVPPSLMDIKTYGLHFITVVIMTYMYSYGGALIYDQSLSVAESAYALNWADKGQITLRKDASFIIFRSQRPTLLTAGHFNINMDAFVTIMQNVISIYGLLTALAADEIVARQMSKEIIRS